MKILLFIGLFFLSLPFISDSNIDRIISIQEDWKLVSTDGDLKVYKKKIEGSAYKALKIESILNGKIEQFVKAMKNVDQYQDWIYKCSKSEKIERLSSTELIYYSVADFPMPLWDRDVVVHSSYKYDTDLDTHFFRSKPGGDEYVEPKPRKMIRVSNFYAAWTLKNLGNNKVSVINEFHFEPAGSVPAWLVNLSVARGPKKTMKGLERIVNKQ